MKCPSDKTHQILASMALAAIEQDHASVPETSSGAAIAIVGSGFVLVRLKRSYQG